MIAYLHHILNETRYLIGETEGLDIGVFHQDETLIRAFVRSLEIIGEATKKLPDDLTRQYPQVEWRRIAGMRNRLIHSYFGIDYGIVWDVIANKLPKFRADIVAIMRQEREVP